MDDFEVMCIEIEEELERAKIAELAASDLTNYHPIVIDDFQTDIDFEV